MLIVHKQLYFITYSFIYTLKLIKSTIALWEILLSNNFRAHLPSLKDLCIAGGAENLGHFRGKNVGLLQQFDWCFHLFYALET